jgi:hypothetical protein
MSSSFFRDGTVRSVGYLATYVHRKAPVRGTLIFQSILEIAALTMKNPITKSCLWIAVPAIAKGAGIVIGDHGYDARSQHCKENQ